MKVKRRETAREQAAGSAAAPPARHWRLLAVAAPIVLAVFLLAPMLAYPFGSDHGSFATAAREMARGSVLYRDVWEIKPPGVYTLFRVAFAFFGPSILAVRAFDLLWTLATAAGLVLLGRRLSSWTAGVLGAFGFLVWYALGFDYWHTAQCDGFTTLPLVLAALFTLEAERRRDWRRAVLAGALVGVAVALKFTVGGFLALPVLFALAARGEPVRGRLLRAGGYVLGTAFVVGGLALYLARLGSLRDMIQIVFVWNGRYGEMRVGGALPKLARFLFGGQYVILKVLGALSLAGLAQLVVARRKRGEDWLVPLWAAAMFLGIVAQGKYFAYHWLPLLAPAGMLAGQGLLYVSASLSRPFSRKGALVLKAVLAAGLLALLGVGYWGQFRNPVRYLVGALPAQEYQAQFTTPDRYFSFAADQAVAEYVREHTTPRDRIFVWGLEPLVYFLADRRPATRFIHDVPLITPWSPPGWHQEVLADLDKTSPRMVLIVHNDSQPWVTLWPEDSYSFLEQGGFPEFADWLQAHYRPTARIEDFEVWERK